MRQHGLCQDAEEGEEVVPATEVPLIRFCIRPDLNLALHPKGDLQANPGACRVLAQALLLNGRHHACLALPAKASDGSRRGSWAR